MGVMEEIYLTDKLPISTNTSTPIITGSAKGAHNTEEFDMTDFEAYEQN